MNTEDGGYVCACATGTPNDPAGEDSGILSVMVMVRDRGGTAIAYLPAAAARELAESLMDAAAEVDMIEKAAAPKPAGESNNIVSPTCAHGTSLFAACPSCAAESKIEV